MTMNNKQYKDKLQVLLNALPKDKDSQIDAIQKIFVPALLGIKEDMDKLSDIDYTPTKADIKVLDDIRNNPDISKLTPKERFAILLKQD